MTSIIVTNRGDGDITRREDFTPEKLRSFGNLDYVFIPFWSWWIPPEIYENWECVIFHMTDLPYGRGGSPLQNLIIRGHRRTMISAIKCVREIDAGPVYLKRGENIFYGTADEIYDRVDKEIRGYMIPYILKHRPRPKPQSGEPVYFEKWNCSYDDVIRAVTTDYEGIGGSGASR